MEEERKPKENLENSDQKNKVVCSTCFGDGFIKNPPGYANATSRCPKCKGTGSINKTETLTIMRFFLLSLIWVLISISTPIYSQSRILLNPVHTSEKIIIANTTSISTHGITLNRVKESEDSTHLTDNSILEIPRDTIEPITWVENMGWKVVVYGDNHKHSFGESFVKTQDIQYFEIGQSYGILHTEHRICKDCRHHEVHFMFFGFKENPFHNLNWLDYGK